MDRAAFYAALRQPGIGVFGATLTAPQVQGMEAILDAGDTLPLSHLAYALATAYGETGGRMQPIVENMNYTSAARLMQVWPSRFPTAQDAAPYVRQPEKLANFVYGGRLGNNQPGDGWRFRGRGLVQLTARDNYAKFGRVIGIDLVADPDAALEMGVAVKALICGIRDGLYTTRKASDYLPGDYVNARRIINGTFEAQKYARYARAFDAALTDAGYAPSPYKEIASLPARERPAQPQETAQAPVAPTTRPSLLTTLLAGLRDMFARN